jgi:hypothetical protein
MILVSGTEENNMTLVQVGFGIQEIGRLLREEEERKGRVDKRMLFIHMCTMFRCGAGMF